MSTPSPAATEAADVEVWWGGYWGWAMLPSWIVCAVAAGTLGFLTWSHLFHTPYCRVAVLAVVFAVGLVQFLRWAARYFGSNYRLTNRQLFIERGVFRPKILHVDLIQLAGVEVQADWLERRLRFGRVILHFEQNRGPPLVLEAVYDAVAVAGLIRGSIEQAHTQVEKDKGPASG